MLLKQGPSWIVRTGFGHKMSCLFTAPASWARSYAWKIVQRYLSTWDRTHGSWCTSTNSSVMCTHYISKNIPSLCWRVITLFGKWEHTLVWSSNKSNASHNWTKLYAKGLPGLLLLQIPRVCSRCLWPPEMAKTSCSLQSGGKSKSNKSLKWSHK